MDYPFSSWSNYMGGVSSYLSTEFCGEEYPNYQNIHDCSKEDVDLVISEQLMQSQDFNATEALNQLLDVIFCSGSRYVIADEYPMVPIINNLIAKGAVMPIERLFKPEEPSGNAEDQSSSNVVKAELLYHLKVDIQLNVEHIFHINWDHITPTWWEDVLDIPISNELQLSILKYQYLYRDNPPLPLPLSAPKPKRDVDREHEELKKSQHFLITCKKINPSSIKNIQKYLSDNAPFMGACWLDGNMLMRAVKTMEPTNCTRRDIDDLITGRIMVASNFEQTFSSTLESLSAQGYKFNEYISDFDKELLTRKYRLLPVRVLDAPVYWACAKKCVRSLCETEKFAAAWFDPENDDTLTNIICAVNDPSGNVSRAELIDMATKKYSWIE